MGKFFFVAAVAAIFFGAISGNLPAVSAAALSESANAVELSLKLLGSLCFWSGIMKLWEKSGLIGAICRGLRPVLGILFPDLKNEDKALGAIAMNMGANILGLGNAATPFGIKAMGELAKIGGKSRATKDMVIFVVMNTASLGLLPTTVAALRATAGAESPLDILPAVWFVSAFALVLGVSFAVLTYPKEKKL